MLLPRIIPVLLVKDKGLVKTVKFRDPKYVGDPINAVKIFNEKEADELTVIDIDASTQNREPDYKLIENLANECRMPLCYGGGIKTFEQAQKILSLGVEKVALSSSAIENPEIISELSIRVGAQSVVLVLDVKKRLIGKKYDCYTYNGTKNTKLCPFEFIERAQKLGVGEIVVNNIDQDGVMKGYDLDLASRFRGQVKVPLTYLGGAGNFQHIEALIRQEKIIGAAAGSAFVFKGKYRAVLINYPKDSEKNKIMSALY
ncbi:MAG: imidazole glycerol phosphate synthase subunit HisF [Hahellaceae bacterium]|nr:imidazole glycerol phosphate synthase subunit HisF [Hahellaceae bacterium]